MRRRVFINRPKSPDTSAIDRINELSKIARTNWFGLLAYLAFAGVTLLGVQDADFFIESRRTTLPLIGVEIPTRDFFIFGPILGSALYVYLHLYLLKLWEALAEAPPRPKGRALSLQVTPWLINDLGLALRRDNAFHRRPMDWLSHLVTFLLVFAVGPIVIGYFWVRYWPAHELGFSIFNALLFTLTTMTMLSSLYTAITRLRYGRTYQGGWWHLMALLPTLVILIPAAALTVAKTDGPGQLGVLRVATEKAYAVTYQILTEIKILPKPIDPEDGTDPYALTIASADLREVEFVSLPADWLGYEVHRRKFRVEWCAQQGLDPKTCGSSKNDGVLEIHNLSAREHWCVNNGYDANPKCKDFFSGLEVQFSKAWKAERQAKLGSFEGWSPRNSDLRAANMAFGLFAGADLRMAQMNGADLSGAQMEGANLFWAQMEGADLSGTRMKGADLSWAQMEGANLSGAQMEGAYLFRAQMEGANLREAQMKGADLSGAQMKAADLRGARMKGAELSGAQMEGAILSGAQMEGANLSRAQMEKADIFGAQMEGADLSGAQMKGAILSRAQMEGAILSGAQMKGAILGRAQLEGANLSEAQMEGAILFAAQMEGANLREAQMEGANLIEAQLEGANLREAQMEGAYLSEAQLEGADLYRAQMKGANLSGARMKRANLSEAQLEGADLSEARMEGAILSRAQLEGADLYRAQLEGADLGWAQMKAADLFEAQLEGADLSDAQMEGADLSGAQMEGADLSWAQLEGADLSEAQMKSVEWAGDMWAAPAHSTDFRGSSSLTQDRLLSLIGNSHTLLPERQDPDTGQFLFIPSCWTTEPTSWSVMVESAAKYNTTEDELRAIYICQLGSIPQKTGTPWPLDKPPPWETDPNWEPEDRGPVIELIEQLR